MKTAKIKQFQFYNSILYVLDEEGTLWKNPNPDNTTNWKVVPVPTIKQHDIEDLASTERYRLDGVEKLNLKFKVNQNLPEN
jgi:hypothetical protein